MILEARKATEWRKIPGKPERYEVSDTGTVRILPYETLVTRKATGKVTKRYIQGRYLESYVSKTDARSKGHPIVSFAAMKSGSTRVCLLVARAFHGCPYTPGDLSAGQKWRVRHIDGDICNNHADNLEWVGNSGPEGSVSLYEQNLRKLAELREEPVEDWIRRMWGEDALDESSVELLLSDVDQCYKRLNQKTA
jgi:hypothetical protein